MTIATTEPVVAPLTGGWCHDADTGIDTGIDIEAAFVDLILADPDLVDVEFAAIVAELGQPEGPPGNAPVPVPRPDRRGVAATRHATSHVDRHARGALEARRRQRSPPDQAPAPRVSVQFSHRIHAVSSGR